MAWNRHPGSFRDASGFVFTHDGHVYRQVNQSFAAQYRRLLDSGLYAELVRDELLVAHEEVGLRLPDAPPACAVLKPDVLPFISYPYEWCFSQYKAAALLTLDLQRRSLERGLMLRDASAYNVQFRDGRPIFIDTLSFGPYEDGRPWPAYRQFCQHFLNPLALMALVDPGLGLLMRSHLDGVPLDLTSRALPASSRLRPGLLTHIHLHSRAGRSGAALHAGTPAQQRLRMSRTALLGLVDSLRRTVEGLSWRPRPTLWSTYEDHTNYPERARQQKRAVVGAWLDRLSARHQLRAVWDLGANTGTYSRVAAEHAPLVVSFDMDPAAVEANYLATLDRHRSRVLPLVQDLTNPSAASGWRHRERQSLVQRGPADVGLALALIHHLVIGANLPLDEVAAFFGETTRHLVIEFVPREDSQVQRMLAVRDDIFGGYSEPGFTAAFRTHFDITDRAAIAGTSRTLYLMRRRL